MARYSIYLTAEASQVIDVEADSFDEAVDLALEQHGLYENISNPYELGDADVYRPACRVDGELIPEAERVTPAADPAAAEREQIVKALGEKFGVTNRAAEWLEREYANRQS